MAGSSLLLALLLAGAGPADGQTVPSAFRRIDQGQEAGAFIGSVSANRGRFEFGPGPGIVYGARYAVELTGPLSFEGVVSAMPMTRDVIDPELAEGRRVAGEADALLVGADVRFKFSLTGRRTWHALSPHLLIGAGFLSDAAGAQEADGRVLEQDRFDFGNTFTALVGGGTRLTLGRSLTLRGDVVMNLWQLETPPGFAAVDRGFENVEDAEWVNAFQFTLGGALRF